MPDFAALDTLLRAPQCPDMATVQALWATLSAERQEDAAALALQQGHPRLVLSWSGLPWVQAPALLRLGEARQAQSILAHLRDSARRTALQARASALLGEAQALTLARAARTQARREGDAGALVAVATLLGELELAEGAPLTALRSLAEGLKVAELTGAEADAHLLAVLAHVQARVGSPAKARQTAARALERSLRRSPARVLALLALGRGEEARQEAQAGELAAAWWGFLGEEKGEEG